VSWERRPLSRDGRASLKTFQINVETFKGVVQLSGFVDSAEYVTKAGQGVKEVKNDLVVK
jgi:osmotically-inducible protein OsmY